MSSDHDNFEPLLRILQEANHLYHAFIPILHVVVTWFGVENGDDSVSYYFQLGSLLLFSAFNSIAVEPPASLLTYIFTVFPLIPPSHKMLFQAVLLTDGSTSFAIFLYLDPNFVLKTPVRQVGFDAGDGNRSASVLPFNRTYAELILDDVVIGDVNIFRIEGTIICSGVGSSFVLGGPSRDWVWSWIGGIVVTSMGNFFRGVLKFGVFFICLK